MFRLLLLTVAFLFGVWHIDILVTCAAKCTLTNGFWWFQGMQIYHLSMYTEIAAFLILAYLYIEERKKNQIKELNTYRKK